MIIKFYESGINLENVQLELKKSEILVQRKPLKGLGLGQLWKIPNNDIWEERTKH